MALIKCKECGKEVSDKAASCPNCGAPISDNITVNLKSGSKVKLTRPGLKWEAIGFVLIAISIFQITASIISKDNSPVGGIMLLIGLIIFTIGRFK